MLLKVDTAVTVPVNVMPLIDDTDFKSIEADVNYNATGLALVWNFVTSAGAQSQTAVTPTNTGGNYDWTEIGGGMFSIEIPASGGASINNDTEGYGWFTGVATGVLPWRGPIITFAPAHVVDGLVTGSDKLQVDVAEWKSETVPATDDTGVPVVNVQYISGDDVDGNNATLKLKYLEIKNSASAAVVFEATGGNDPGFYCKGNGSGAGLTLAGGGGVALSVQAATGSAAADFVSGSGEPIVINLKQSDGSMGTLRGMVSLSDDAITAAKFNETDAFPLGQADTGATAVARTGADSDTLEVLSDEIDAISALIGTPADTDIATDIANIATTVGTPANVTVSADIAAISTLIGTPADTDVSTDIANIATTIGTPADTDVSTDIANISTLIGTPVTDLTTDISTISTTLGAPANVTVSADIAAVAAVTTKLDSTMELDGAGPAYQFTAAAMDQATASVDVSDFFDTDSGETAASAVAGSVVYELLTNVPANTWNTVSGVDGETYGEVIELLHSILYASFIGFSADSADALVVTGDSWAAGTTITVNAMSPSGSATTLGVWDVDGSTWTPDAGWTSPVDGVLLGLAVPGPTGGHSGGVLNLQFASRDIMRVFVPAVAEGQAGEIQRFLADGSPLAWSAGLYKLLNRSEAAKNVATITRNVDNTIDETTHADGSVSKINYTGGYATSVTEA